MVNRIHNAVVASAALSSVALLATAALLAPGCTVLTDDALPDDAGPESESSPSPSEGGPSLGCEGCLVQACVASTAVCFSDEGCVADHFCTKAAGASCGVDGSADTGVRAKIAAFVACNEQKTCGQCAAFCASTCGDGGPTCDIDAGDAGDMDASEAATDAEAGAPDAGDAEVEGGASVDACSACVSATCAPARVACAIGTSCASFLTCVHACGDTACAENCGQRFADGKAKATELSNCTLAGCRGACAL